MISIKTHRTIAMSLDVNVTILMTSAWITGRRTWWFCPSFPLNRWKCVTLDSTNRNLLHQPLKIFTASIANWKFHQLDKFDNPITWYGKHRGTISVATEFYARNIIYIHLNLTLIAKVSISKRCQLYYQKHLMIFWLPPLVGVIRCKRRARKRSRLE